MDTMVIHQIAHSAIMCTAMMKPPPVFVGNQIQ